MIVTGSFDNWTQSAVLSPSSQGHSASVHIPVEKTLFKFVVDGEWKVDESFATETDEHGNVNNVLTEEVLEGYEGDIQEITKDVPGAFPIVSEADDGEGDGTVAKEGDGNVSKTVSGVSGPSGAVSGASGAALGALGASGAVLGASSTSHDLKPSHLDPSAESQLSSTLETKKEAVSGGGFVPAAAESAIPAGSTSSQDVVSHDLQPSHLDPKAQSTLENAIEGKFEAVESGQLDPIAGINRDVVNEQNVEKDLAPVAALSAGADSSSRPLSVDPICKSADPVPSSDHVTSSSPKSPNKHAIPVASYGFPEGEAGNVGSSQSGNFSSAHASIPLAAAAHALTMHDLQPSALDPHAAATLDHTISTKYSAVESGAISPVDSTGQSRAVPSTPTKGRHDSEYDHVTELRDEYGGSPRENAGSRDNTGARVPPSPGIGSGFDEVKPKERGAESAGLGHVKGVPTSESRFHENETAPPSPNPMSPHLASLAKKEGIPVEGGVEGGAPVSEPVSGVAGVSGVSGVSEPVSGLAPTSVGSAIPTSTASSLHSAAATKSVAPGTPSSTAANLNVEAPGGSGPSQSVSGVSQSSGPSQTSPLASGASQNVPDVSAAPATPVASAPAAPASAPIVAAPATASAHASVASAPATAADVTMKAGASKKDKRRSIFRKIKDKMF